MPTASNCSRSGSKGPARPPWSIGYRLAMLLAGAGALVIAEFAGWFWAYAAMAGCLGLGIVTVLFAPEPEASAVALAREAMMGRHSG